MSGATFRIQRLGIEGFKAFAAPQSLDMGGHVFVFGRNGLGKSSVVEAIRWCLFGLADRPEVEVRNVFYPAGECKVEVELEGPGGRWRIQRRLRPGSGRSDLTILDPTGATMPLSQVFPHIARLGPREGTHIILASQQSTHRRLQADITDFDKVLYSYLQIEDVPDLLGRLEGVLEEQGEIDQQLAEDVDRAEESLRSKLEELRSRSDEILAAKPWPGETVPTNAETDARLRRFVEECAGSLKRADGGAVTREWLLTEAERALQQSVATKEAVQGQVDEAQVALERLASAEETFEDLTAQLKTLQARVKAREEDLRSALGGTTGQQLLGERNQLARQGTQLERSLALAQQAAGYFDEFSVEKCPVCESDVDTEDVVPQLRARVGSDRRARELAEASTNVQASLIAIELAKTAVAAAKTAHESMESRVEAARKQLEKLLNDPTDLSSSDRTIELLSERIEQLELELRDAGALVTNRRNTLNSIRAETRFQAYRSREERLQHNLESGLEPAREALRKFTEVLEASRSIREALQKAFNNTLDRTKPQVDRLMTEVYGRLTQQASFPDVVVESGPAEMPRSVCIRVTSSRTPGKSFEPSEVLNGQAFSALNLVPYFVFSQFQAEALELDCLLIDDPSQSFDTSRVELLIQELAAAATHAQLIVASHEEDRFAPFIDRYFPSGSYRVLRVTSFAPDLGPTLE